MKVILLKDVSGTGRADEIKEVSAGFARNFLFPRRLAREANEKALKELRAKQARQEREESRTRQEYRDFAGRLALTPIIIKIKVGDKGRAFGSVNAPMIAKELAKKGIPVHEDWIRLAKPLKTAGERKIKIIFPGGIEGEASLAVQAEE
jgi:large subunit ribosomal protein L9